MNLTAKKLVGLPSKPRRRWKPLIFGLLGLVLLVILGVAGFLLMRSRAVDRQFGLGNRHYDKALNKLDEMVDEPAMARKRLRGVRSELDSAAKAFRRMKTSASGWERRSAEMSLKSLAHAGQGVERLESRTDEIEHLIKARSRIEQAADDFNKAFVKANEAITAGNDDKYAQAKLSAVEADRLFRRSQELLAKASKVSATSEIADVIPRINKARQWARAVEKMVDAGEAGRFSEYNDLARENNRLSEETADIARSSVLSNPRGWLRVKLEKVDDGVAVHFNQADKWRDKALSLWGKNIQL